MLRTQVLSSAGYIWSDTRVQTGINAFLKSVATSSAEYHPSYMKHARVFTTTRRLFTARPIEHSADMRYA